MSELRVILPRPARVAKQGRPSVKTMLGGTLGGWGVLWDDVYDRQVWVLCLKFGWPIPSGRPIVRWDAEHRGAIGVICVCRVAPFNELMRRFKAEEIKFLKVWWGTRGQDENVVGGPPKPNRTFVPPFNNERTRGRRDYVEKILPR